MAGGWDHAEASSPTCVVPVMTRRPGISGTADQAPKCGHCDSMGFPTTWRFGVPSVECRGREGRGCTASEVTLHHFRCSLLTEIVIASQIQREGTRAPPLNGKRAKEAMFENHHG